MYGNRISRIALKSISKTPPFGLLFGLWHQLLFAIFFFSIELVLNFDQAKITSQQQRPLLLKAFQSRNDVLFSKVFKENKFQIVET